MWGIILVLQIACHNVSHAAQPSPRFLGSLEQHHVKQLGEQTVPMTRKGLPVLSPSQIFRLAYKDYLKGRYQLAIETFQQYIKDYPTSSLTPQAYFYLGEAYANNQDWASAEKAFNTLATKFSSSPLVPLTLFKLGNVKAQTGKPRDARFYWSRIIKEFPRSLEAKLAQRDMAKIHFFEKKEQETGKQDILNHGN